MSVPASIQSMTGFASLEGERDGVGWQLDARSVNGRSLDVRMRLPSGLERREAELRSLVTKTFRRGTINVSLTLRRAEGATRYHVNQDQLAAYLEAIQELAASGSVAAPRADGLLALKGVVESAGEDEASLIEPILAEAAKKVVHELQADRLAEGARIAPLIEDQLAEMDTLREAIDNHPERTPERVKDRLDKALSELLSSGNGLSAERLHQEAALLATRSDVREELDRLAAHVASARDLLADGGPIGRKLDFLAQELNRETNTICAKSPHHAVTQLGLDLKALVEQMREQVQNLE